MHRHTAQSLRLIRSVMNSTDFLIIYFACGAPFAVYYFLQNRYDDSTVLFWLKNVLVFLFWVPFAASLLMQSQGRDGFFDLKALGSFFNFNKDSNTEKLFESQKQIENILLESDLEISIFDFRETAERYAGLTIAAKSEGDSGREIFRVAKNNNVELGTICLQRRNRSKLLRHQTAARRDFLELVEHLSDSISNTELLQRPALEVVRMLNDEVARESLEKMFAGNLQTGKLSNVEYLEKDLWKPQEHKPLRTKTVSTRS